MKCDGRVLETKTYLCNKLHKKEMKFTDLNIHGQILKALDDLQYTQPTIIQQKAFPVIQSGRDVVGIAQTGTGKTMAYLLPIISGWKFTKEPHPQIVILVPTRELVVQVVREAEKLATYLSIRIQGVYGGANINTQHDRVAAGVDMLVATPGRLRDLILKGSVRMKNVKKLVIDEVDEMLNLGFRYQLVGLFDFFPEKRQNLMFSATITDDVEALIDVYFRQPERVEAARTGTPLTNIWQSAYSVPNFNTKINLLRHLLVDHASFNKTLVFTTSRKMAEMVFDKVDEMFPNETAVIHSNKAQNTRFSTVRNFHSGDIRILVATDLVARGIDISEVTHVINFDMPEHAETYMHRIGRTGRADKMGQAISFVTPKDAESRQAIEELMNMAIPEKDFPESVAISTQLIESELEVVLSPNIELKPIVRENAGASYTPKTDLSVHKKKKVKKRIIKQYARDTSHKLHSRRHS